MPLSKKEVAELMRLVGLTEDDEINCEQCLALVSELADRALAGKSIPEELRQVVQHLSVCSECKEEYEALENALGEIGGRGGSGSR